jgi:hypothetical protein
VTPPGRLIEPLIVGHAADCDKRSDPVHESPAPQFPAEYRQSLMLRAHARSCDRDGHTSVRHSSAITVSRFLLSTAPQPREEDAMSKLSPATRSDVRPAISAEGRRTRGPIVLWRLHGATDELRGLVFETSFGYAFGLELDAELVLLHLQPDLKRLVAYADRIERALVAQGWQVITASSKGRSLHASRRSVSNIVS